MEAVNSDKPVHPRTESESPRDPPSAACRQSRPAIPLEADESDLPPSPRPSNAHVHVTVRPSSQTASSSTASLPSMVAGRAGRTSINTQGYLLTTPMSQDRSARRGRRHPPGSSSSSSSGRCCFGTGGCCFSSSEGACGSDGGGCCCSRFDDDAERAPTSVETVRGG
ncbi:hypothetical protein Trco_006736 [Trichoderma cornu-damae]|uniref:Uncharacterized protein n=1 Tax=Trichoderma cornu-damae TaxID=654480 RepID=A0A9P8TU09_9HYPO|nr:hypothetical protein Trco_006736 [Trichoderma cornu-damae]